MYTLRVGPKNCHSFWNWKYCQFFVIFFFKSKIQTVLGPEGDSCVGWFYNKIVCSGKHSNRQWFHFDSIWFIPWHSKPTVPFILWGNSHYSLIGGSLSVTVWRDHRKYSSFAFLCFTFFTRPILPDGPSLKGKTSRKKSSCSFGFCPNEGEGGETCPNFLSPFHKCIFG